MPWHHSATNPLALLGVTFREDVITRLFAAALEEHPESRASFVLPFVSASTPLPTSESPWLVGTQVAVADSRLDLVCAWIVDGTTHVLVVEHKLYAGVDETQMQRYCAAAEALRKVVAGQFEYHGSIEFAGAPHLAHLTLYADSVDGVRAVRHESLLGWLDTLRRPATSTPLMEAWADLIRTLLARVADAERIPFAESFRQPSLHALDARRPLFERFVGAVASQLDLDEHDVYVYSPQGRAWLGSHLLRRTWRAAASERQRAGAPASLLPEPYIHFQLQIDLLDESGVPADLVLALNYETWPYRPRAEANAKFTPDALAHYLAFRQSFQSHEPLRQRLERGGFAIRGRWNHVAKCRLALGPDDSWNEVVSRAVEQLRPLVLAVDELIHGTTR